MDTEHTVDGIVALVGWTFAHEWTLLWVVGAFTLTVLALRVGYTVAVLLADLRLKRHAGDAAEALAGWLGERGPDGRSNLYAAYMGSPQWAARSRRTLTLAGGACQHQGPRCTGRATEAHHLHYRDFTREADGSLLAVCKRCHDELHGRER